jgi:hypothetical protein
VESGVTYINKGMEAAINYRAEASSYRNLSSICKRMDPCSREVSFSEAWYLSPIPCATFLALAEWGSKLGTFAELSARFSLPKSIRASHISPFQWSLRHPSRAPFVIPNFRIRVGHSSCSTSQTRINPSLLRRRFQIHRKTQLLIIS